MKSSSPKSKHLSLDDRRLIYNGIQHGWTLTQIAETVDKNKSTVSLEIRHHRIQIKNKNCYPVDCAKFAKCPNRGKQCCSKCCENYVPFSCKRRDHAPGACNGCPNYGRCHYFKYSYNPDKANNEYRETLVDSRLGANLTYEEAKRIAEIVAPLLKKGQSPYQIIREHPELGICEKTLYNYIEDETLPDPYGISVLHLRLQAKRKLPKAKKVLYKKRKDLKALKDRDYEHYLSYVENNPSAHVIQMDTVYNHLSGPFIQTFLVVETGLMLAVLHGSKTAEDMQGGIDFLENILTPEIFGKYFNVILTDRGSEFIRADEMEHSVSGSRRTKLFFCDPMQAGQKGALEQRHIALRYILPKGEDLYNLGLRTQDDLNLVMSHLNSMPLEKLGGKTPLELTKFMFPDLFDKVMSLGIKEIDEDEIVLKPDLLKNRRSPSDSNIAGK